MQKGKASNWDDPIENAKYWASLNGGIKPGIKHYENVLQNIDQLPAAYGPDARQSAEAALDYLKKVDAGEIELPREGRMYEVNVNANPEDFLDWDAPLSDQPEIARRMGIPSPLDEADRLLRQLQDDMAAAGRSEMNSADRAIYDQIEQLERQHATRSGAGAYADLERAYARTGANVSPPKMAAQELLHDYGIPGIRYRDAGSRGAEDGTRNYVVFDENLIEIVRKYGISGAAALLGLSAQEVEAGMQRTNQAQAQAIRNRGAQ